MLPQLTLDVARTSPHAPERLDGIRRAPVRVLQIGTGNFLRAFTGWMFERMNRQGLFQGAIAVAQATPQSRTTQVLRRQDGFYTVVQRGLASETLVERFDLVTCVTRVVDPYTEWGELLAIGAEPELRYVVSNTTEAGIVYQHMDGPPHTCPPSFPARMTAILFHRFSTRHGQAGADAGLVFLPCELTDRNGELLREIVLRHASDWRLGREFCEWVLRQCRFCNTLVNRIVTGYPADEADRIEMQLGYRDELLVACELDYDWVIEAPPELARELPFEQAGLHVRWTGDVTPYRTRKVRLLNGAHTVMTPVAFLAGRDTVLEAINDPLIARFVEGALVGEILPVLAADAEAGAFTADMLNRFRNPTIRHRLLSIALNTTSKWKVRVLPSLQDALAATGRLPRRLAFSLAALIVLYRVRIGEENVGLGDRNGRPYELRDTADALKFMQQAWEAFERHRDARQLVHQVLANAALWDSDLNSIRGLTEQVSSDLRTIMQHGMHNALERLER